MSLIGTFFGLLAGSGYAAYQALTGSRANRKCRNEYESMRLRRIELISLLVDYELERQVRAFVSTCGADTIKNLLKTELDYIANGNEAITNWFMAQQHFHVECILSHFGKLSSSALICSTYVFGPVSKITEQDTEYDVTVRTLQCIESNLKHTTGQEILFGAENSISGSFNGKYPRARIAIAGTYPILYRSYKFVDLPFSEISKQDIGIMT